MASLTDLLDLAHNWGSDLAITATGALATVSRVDRSKQRVLRRLLTNPGDYIFHPSYGAGVPSKIGQNLDIPAVTGLIRGQMLLEESVAQSPEPAVVVTPITNGCAVRISYIVAPERTPAVLSFDVTR